MGGAHNNASGMEKSGGSNLSRMIRLINEERTARDRQRLQTLSDEELEKLGRNYQQQRNKERRRQREAVLEYPFRAIVKRLQKRFISPTPKGLERFGNYRLLKTSVREEPLVYSAGVGGNITFDTALAGKLSAQVHLFDPTPRSIAFMAAQPKNERLHFHPWAVYTEDGPLDLYFDNATALSEVSNASVINLAGASRKFRSQAFRVRTIMNKLGHDRVDILKLDIEGAAPAVLVQTLSDGILPQQVLCEFERPVGFHRVGLQAEYLAQVRRALQALRDSQYEIYKIRDSHYERQLEILAVRQ